MPKGKIPRYGRSRTEVRDDLLRAYSADVPLGNNNPTVVQGELYGGMPNRSRMARGGLRQLRGKYSK